MSSVPFVSRAESAANVSARGLQVAVLDDNLPGLDSERIDIVRTALAADGVRVTEIDAGALAEPIRFNARKFDALVLTDARRFPAGAADNLIDFLEDGGDLALLGGHAFATPISLVDGQWLDPTEIKEHLAADDDSVRTLLSFDDFDAEAWKRDASNQEGESWVAAVLGRGGWVVRMTLRGVTGWDTFKRELPRGIDPRTDTLCFWARSGSEETRQMAVELVDTTEARWIATVDLDPSWQFYALPSHAFDYHGGGRPPTDHRPTIRLHEAAEISFGLARGYSRFEGEKHDLWIDDVGVAYTGLGAAGKLDRLELFTDLPPFQYQAAAVATNEEGADLLAGGFHFKGPVAGTAAFAVPRAGESQIYPLLVTRDNANGITAGAIFAHYAGRFARSQWLLLSPTTEAFYLHPDFPDLLQRSFRVLHSGELVNRARRDNALNENLAETLGFTHVGGKYHFTNGDFLNEGARVLERLGTRTIKLWLSRPERSYPYNHDWGEITEMVQLARTQPYREVFDRPFTTYYLEAFAAPAGSVSFRNGLTTAERYKVTRQFYDLTRHLLVTYRGTGKTFVLQNWEGDWALRDAMDRTIDPKPQAIAGMIDWLNARQEGVDRARDEVGERGVSVFHAAEVNLVLPSLRDSRPGVVTDVLPHTRVDLASYSNYESDDDPRAFRAALDFIAMNMPASDHVQGNRVVVGEFGAPASRIGLDAVKRRLSNSVEIGAAFGCRHLLYWQLFCNELHGDAVPPVKSNDEVNGFWLVKPDGTKAWAWRYFEELLDAH